MNIHAHIQALTRIYSMFENIQQFPNSWWNCLCGFCAENNDTCIKNAAGHYQSKSIISYYSACLAAIDDNIVNPIFKTDWDLYLYLGDIKS